MERPGLVALAVLLHALHELHPGVDDERVLALPPERLHRVVVDHGERGPRPLAVEARRLDVRVRAAAARVVEGAELLVVALLRPDEDDPVLPLEAVPLLRDDVEVVGREAVPRLLASLLPLEGAVILREVGVEVGARDPAKRDQERDDEDRAVHLDLRGSDCTGVR
jgi:hypothetical protein